MTVAAAPPRQILVATDMSHSAGTAVSRAVQLSQQHGAHLTALHVLPAELDVQFTADARGDLASHIAPYAEAAEVELVIRRGNAAGEIAAEAAERGADLVLAGAHGAHWLADAFLGSTAENLVRLSPSPVLLVKKPATAEYRTVLIAVDMSAPAAQAAWFASALTPSAQHILAHACTIVGEGLLRLHGAADDEIEELRRVATEEVRVHLAHLAETLTPRPGRILVTVGYPPTRLSELQHSYAAELTVVGTGARSPVSYALLGSVAQQVMRQIESDVLVVPAPEI